MYTEADRDALLGELISYAHADPAVTAAALVGSAARGANDRWSDIDLAIGLTPDAEPVAIADTWQQHLATTHDVVDRLDLWSGRTLYRVFLLADSLQVDVSFWPAGTFASNGEPFELLFGEAGRPVAPGNAEPRDAIRWAWLYALHARAALGRGRTWQALLMMDGLRDRVIALACLRHGVAAHQGRGVDLLPAAVLSRLTGSLAGSPQSAPLGAAFSRLVDLLAEEIDAVDPTLAARLRPVLTLLVETAGPV